MTKRGELERQIMEILWDEGAATVRDVLGRLGGRLAYTTVMTVLDRLHAKGRVVRKKEGQAWRYSAAEPRAAVVGREAARLLAEAADEPTLMAFIDRAEQADPAVLDRLERMIKEHRRRRGKR